MKYIILAFFSTILVSLNSFAALPPISGTTSICLGSTSALTDASTGGTWTSNNTAIATVDTNSGVVTAVSSGVTVITYTLGASFTITSVTVNALPNVYVVGGGGSYCSGGSGVAVTLSKSDIGINYQLYHGTFAVASPDSGTGSGLTWPSMLAHGGYTVVATNRTTGCFDTMSGSANVTINPLPAVDTLYVGGTGHYCSGGAGLDVYVHPSTTGITYRLFDYSTPEGIAFGNTGLPADFGLQTSAGVYKATATNSFGCSIAMAANPTITIDPLPTMCTISAGGSYCAGSAGVDITLPCSDLSTTYDLVERGTVVGTRTGIGSKLDFGLHTDTGIYIITAVNSHGCADTMAGTAKITVLPLPTGITGTTVICAGATTKLSDGTSGGTWTSLSTAIATINPTSGVVLGLTSGIANIRYSTATCGYASMAVTVNALPTAYSTSGGGAYCLGGTGAHVFIAHSDLGINYSLLDTVPVATKPGTGSSIDFGAQTKAGGYTVMATNPVTGCSNEMIGSVPIYINPLPTVYTVTGGGHYCSGGLGKHIGLSYSSSAATYSLYDGITHVGPTLAGGSGSLDFGSFTGTGTYKVVAINTGSGCTDTMSSSANIIIDPLASVTGSTQICAGASGSLTPSLGGGTWTSSSTAVVTVNYLSGAISGIIAGTAMISYTTTLGCLTTIADTVNALPAITGGSSVCVGSKLTLTAPFGGTWSSSYPAIATVAPVGGSLGVVTGLSAGIDTLTYILGTGCLSSVSVAVLPLPVISASATKAACGSTYALAATGGLSYSWSPAAGIACDTCAATSVNPTATTTYTVTANGITGCYNSDTVTVNANRVYGYISLGGIAPSSLNMEVLLIKYDPTDTASSFIDSTTTCSVSGLGYYEFDNVPAGDYLVQARLINGANPGGSGYVPTYGTSSPHWDSGAYVIHYSGSDSMHINMAYGTVSGGNGLIRGKIISGAGKGTSGDIPAAGMLVFLENEFTNVLTYTYTDTGGNYSFSHLGAGNYIIYPEEYIYATNASSVISLYTGNDSATGIDFRKYTSSRIIVPYSIASGIKEVTAASWSVNMFPNPSKGSIAIVENPAGITDVTITDVMGRQVYSQTLNVTPQSATNTEGKAEIDLRGLTNGMYIISVKSDNNTYTGRIMIQK